MHIYMYTQLTAQINADAPTTHTNTNSTTETASVASSCVPLWLNWMRVQ